MPRMRLATEMAGAILRSLCITSVLAGALLAVPGAVNATPAAPSTALRGQNGSFAILGPSFAHGKVDPVLKGRIVARARLALGRTPRPSAHIRIEGTSSGQTKAPGAANVAPASQDEIVAARASLEDMEVMFDLALAWRLTGDKRYTASRDLCRPDARLAVSRLARDGIPQVADERANCRSPYRRRTSPRRGRPARCRASDHA